MGLVLRLASRLAVLGVLVAAWAVVVLLSTATPAAAAVDAGAEAELVCLTNAERAQTGAPALRVANDLTRLARSHSAHMANTSRLHHNPTLTSDVANWRIVGENVGRGPSVSAIHRALMNSTGHRRNILDDRFTEIGIGIEVRNGTVWVTQVFRTPRSGTTGTVPACGGTARTTAGGMPTGAIPVAGDFNGDGRTTAGYFHRGTWHLTNALSPGTEITFDFGQHGDLPVVGDFNNNGRDTIGVMRNGRWLLRNTLSAGPADLTFTFGQAGDHPIVGNWNGRGADGIGIIRDREWQLRNALSTGPADHRFIFGRLTAGDIALVGDWNRNGQDTIGIVRQGEWHLRNDLRGGAGQIVFVYGRVLRGDVPVIGDWNRNGISGVGIVRNGEWYLRNRLSGGNAELQFRL